MDESVKPLPELKKRVLTLQQLSLPGNRLGAAGEQLAISFLQQQGFNVLDVNVMLAQYELDIVVFDPIQQEIVFVEVKTRSSDTFGHPSLGVDQRKVSALQRAAIRYLEKKRFAWDFRFDVVTVLPGKIEHFENVTW